MCCSCIVPVLRIGHDIINSPTCFSALDCPCGAVFVSHLPIFPWSYCHGVGISPHRPFSYFGFFHFAICIMLRRWRIFFRCVPFPFSVSSGVWSYYVARGICSGVIHPSSSHHPICPFASVRHMIMCRLHGLGKISLTSPQCFFRYSSVHYVAHRWLGSGWPFSSSRDPS